MSRLQFMIEVVDSLSREWLICQMLDVMENMKGILNCFERGKD